MTPPEIGGSSSNHDELCSFTPLSMVLHFCTFKASTAFVRLRRDSQISAGKNDAVVMVDFSDNDGLLAAMGDRRTLYIPT
jgi:hypothetical protein